MRPHGRAYVDVNSPRAWAVCDRCGLLYNHYKLRWQHDWRGPRLQNLRFLVCPTCYDTYQQNGQRTIILPPDPLPIMNPRVEYYVQDDNPVSGLGASPRPDLWQYSMQIGTMTNMAGVPAAFNGVINKPAAQSACITVSSSYANYVGLNWTGVGLTSQSTAGIPTTTHTLSSYAFYAPNDTGFGSTAYLVQGSSIGGAFANWTTLSSGTLANTAGESITGTPNGGTDYQYHRLAFLGGGGPVYVAQVKFSISDGGSN